MVGAAVCRRLSSEPNVALLTRDRSDLDLRLESDVVRYFQAVRPQTVVCAAARVGGIFANKSYPVEFLADNLRIELAVIRAAHLTGVQRLLFLGSTCIYPRFAKQPIAEDQLLTSSLEETNEAYALAKIAGLKLCQYYRRQYGVLFHSAMPTNLYGPRDNYHPEHSHVLPALLRRFHAAKLANQNEVTIWGTGTPRREFLHVDDLADALVHLLKLENPPDWVNVGTGEDLPIIDLAGIIARTVGYSGTIRTDTSKPDGTPRKLTDSSLLRSLGWRPRIGLEDGIAMTYGHFLQEQSEHLLREVGPPSG